ncbi:hypothetical protein DCW30_29310 [Streptomyces alfalfae]|nr:hypothetical protein D3X13_14030 [Streptomyces fradiae]RXX37470.1 hypothetical protein DCW30_29310 [Streptomyces alfalfae]RZM99395.1 hypothetical protein D4104_10385 [Streptomyces alfalfae]
MTPRARARRRLLAGALLGALLAPALLTGCAESVDPIERLGRKAAEKVPRRSPGEPRCGRASHAAVGVSPARTELRARGRADTAPAAGPRVTGRSRAAETARQEPTGAGNRCQDTPVPSPPGPAATGEP